MNAVGVSGFPRNEVDQAVPIAVEEELEGAVPPIQVSRDQLLVGEKVQGKCLAHAVLRCAC